MRIRKRFAIKFLIAEFLLENVFTHMKGPLWPKTLGYMDRLQEREYKLGYEYRRTSLNRFIKGYEDNDHRN